MGPWHEFFDALSKFLQDNPFMWMIILLVVIFSFGFVDKMTDD